MQTLNTLTLHTHTRSPTQTLSHNVMWGRCLNEWHMAYETDKAQPPVDAPFDTRCGSADIFWGQWQLLLKDGCRQSNQSVYLTDFWTWSSDHRWNSPHLPTPAISFNSSLLFFLIKLIKNRIWSQLRFMQNVLMLQFSCIWMYFLGDRLALRHLGLLNAYKINFAWLYLSDDSVQEKKKKCSAISYQTVLGEIYFVLFWV